MTAGSTHSPYDRAGGASGVRRLVARFYELMDQLPEAAHVRRMHPDDLSGSREKLFEFLSGWLGGPALYVERRGHPRLRMRHMPFSIDAAARDAWLSCMDRALQECIDEALLRTLLRGSFVRMADHLRNVEEEAGAREQQLDSGEQAAGEPPRSEDG